MEFSSQDRFYLIVAQQLHMHRLDATARVVIDVRSRFIIGRTSPAASTARGESSTGSAEMMAQK